MNKSTMIVGIVVLVLVIVGGLFFTNQQSQKAEQTKMAQEKAAMKAKEDAAMKKKETSAGGKDEAAMMKKNEEVMTMAMQDTTSKKATLSDVSGGSGTGKAFVLRKSGKLFFTATANLADPQNGTFYEGWLAVKGANPPKFVDTGKLSKQKDGSYEVSYSSDNLYEGYNLVVITWEQVDDQKPEKHILEGTAQ